MNRAYATTRAPDALDLYETIAIAASTLRISADSIYSAARNHRFTATTDTFRNDARAAANRVLAALDEWEAAI